MKKIKDLELGYADAENYKRRENKALFNKIFIRGKELDKLCDHRVSFLIGEKGTGKTAYSMFLANNNYKETLANVRYIRETEYTKFVELKQLKHLSLSDYASIWKTILLVLMSRQVKEKEGGISQLLNYPLFAAIDDAIEEFYHSAFTPEIIQALEFVEESESSAELIAKYLKLKSGDKVGSKVSGAKFQVNLMYIQRQFESALAQIRLRQNHIIFIDGIDIRPSTLDYADYLECIKGLANAVWELNNDFFPTIKGGGGRMRIVLLIRPDIFESLGLQNQNTKIRDNSVYLDWRCEYINHRASQLFQVTDHLLASQQSVVPAAGESWDSYFPWDSPNVFDSYPHPTSFINFLRWSYYRPRDIVVMLELLKENFGEIRDEKLLLEDFENPTFVRDYSNYLLGEVKDHLSFYYSATDYEAFLKFFEFLSGENKFQYDEYLAAFDSFRQHLESTGNAAPKFTSSAATFLQFLFELNVICYIERTEDNKPFIHWCFRDRSYANISPKVKTGAEYQVFYGLAKALNLGKAFKHKH